MPFKIGIEEAVAKLEVALGRFRCYKAGRFFGLGVTDQGPVLTNRMKKDRLLPFIGIAFAVVLVAYIAGFALIEGARSRHGGWQVKFESDEVGKPAVTIEQPSLKIRGVRLVFEEERIGRTNWSQTMVFDKPHTNTPIGRVIFIDTTILPGVLTLDLFGHEIELLPRTLVVNRREVQWPDGTNLVLHATDALLPPKDNVPPQE